ncbi:hypothetical protein [Vulcanisaeta distributa]|uniref:hypothetical protein n=1 Tax=Vulcanisaeta distributa TaxID=164451 RepID=UPI0006D0F4DA|nr:hypothetical protein [Vulcanisaeta distributa]
MVLKRLLITQLVLYTVVIAFLAYLGVDDFAIYISLVTLIYLVTIITAHPLPPGTRRVANVVTAVLVAVFLYFAITRILQILGVAFI